MKHFISNNIVSLKVRCSKWLRLRTERLQLTLEQCVVMGLTPHTIENLYITFDPLKVNFYNCPSVAIGAWFQDLSRHQNSWMLKSPTKKWHRSVHSVSPPHLRTPHCRSKIVQVFAGEKTPTKTQGPVQFKPMLFKGRL